MVDPLPQGLDDHSAGPHKKRSLSKRILVGVITIVLAWLLTWVMAKVLIVSVPLEHADVIVVLSGSAAYRERTLHAAELYRSGVAKRIILTNDGNRGSWSSVEQRNPYFYERSREELETQGVPQEAIVVLPQPVASTRDEALVVKSYIEANSIHSLVVVTSAYHSRRALWTLSRTFAGTTVVVGIQPAPTGLQTPRPAWWWTSIAGWEGVPLEYLKLIFYRLNY